MEFGIEIPEAKPFDAVALGLNAVDHLIVVPHYPEFNSKIAYHSHHRAAGGQCATAMVTLARLGLSTSYIGRVGSDEAGRFQISSLAAEGVDTSGVVAVEEAETQNAFIIIDQATGERTILWRRDERLTIREEEVDERTVTAGRVLHIDGHDVAASIAAARFARAAKIPVVLDIDNVYAGVERLLPLVDLLISSSTFPEQMTGERDIAAALKRLARDFRLFARGRDTWKRRRALLHSRPVHSLARIQDRVPRHDRRGRRFSRRVYLRFIEKIFCRRDAQVC